MFINASQEYQEGKNQNYLRDQEIEKIVGVYKNYKDADKYCRVVSLDEIKENDYNLNISRYVDTSEEEEIIDVRQALKELKELEQQRKEIDAKMNEYLQELGYGE